MDLNVRAHCLELQRGVHRQKLFLFLYRKLYIILEDPKFDMGVRQFLVPPKGFKFFSLQI